MKSVFLLAVISVCVLSSCEGTRYRFWPSRWSWFRPRNVMYTIRNTLTEPTFEVKQSFKMRLWGREPFIRIMERAAEADKRFRFSADYFNDELGYFITTINNVTGNFNRDQTFWAFLSAPDIFLNKGVSNYFPSAGEHIIFNFTMGGHS